jgi:serine/threonine protein kinase
MYYAMKLVRGLTFDEWAKAQTSLSAILRMFQRICEAVAFAHANGVVHRDLKPANIMIGAFGEALVMDWGVGRELAVPDEGELVGTPAFMAPEQKAGGALDARVDVFGLGATLREVMSARGGSSAAANAIVEKATAERRGDRYASAKELADDVGRCLDGERVHAHSETLAERVQRLAARHRVVLGFDDPRRASAEDEHPDVVERVRPHRRGETSRHVDDRQNEPEQRAEGE